MIVEEDKKEEKKIEELEIKNMEELLSLEQLIVLLEDIKNIEISNINFINKILEEVEFKTDLILGNIGNICKSYFESYYEKKKKQTENLNQLIVLMKSKSFAKSVNENEEFVIVYNDGNLANSDQKVNENYIYKKDIFEIIDSLKLINEHNNEFNEIYEININKNLNNIKEMKNFKELDYLKEVKEEKVLFTTKIANICKLGTESNDFQEVKNILLNDDSDEQIKSTWMINYFNKFRSNLSSVDQNIFNALKELFDILINKFYEKKVFEQLDLAIILLQTFSIQKDNNNYLLEEEFKDKELFQKEDFWKNTMIQKIDDLVEKINLERKDDIGSKEYINYAKENIEPIILSFVFSMKDFNVPEEKEKKIIEDICNNDKYAQYKFDIEKLLNYS